MIIRFDAEFGSYFTVSLELRINVDMSHSIAPKARLVLRHWFVALICDFGWKFPCNRLAMPARKLAALQHEHLRVRSDCALVIMKTWCIVRQVNIVFILHDLKFGEAFNNRLHWCELLVW